MYFGYLVSDMGFILPNFGIQNLIMFMMQWMFQFGRIVQEERLLSKDASDREYTSRVRYRLVRGSFERAVPRHGSLTHMPKLSGSDG
jgi:protein-S-isoprenylcysteine O-methyltransferase Ste14